MSNVYYLKDYPYVGVLADLCSEFISEKRALGLKYNAEAERLWEFSRFTKNFNCLPNTLVEEIVAAWLEKRPNESDRNRHSRFSVIKSFAEYMCRLGYCAYIPDKDEIGKIRSSFVPHIFTHNEIQRFFAAADKMKKAQSTMSPRRHIVMPVLFRILYCCGLRVSEATGLRGKDVDLKNALLTIQNSKLTKNRYVPMSDELTQTCAKYDASRYVDTSGDDWFLSGPNGVRYSNQTIYGAFREILREAEIPHIGNGKGPRVHDFRHTFAVHCLEKLVVNGSDLTVALPKLSSYLGHVGLESSEYYLRMTAEAYPHVSELLNEKLGYIIPKEEFHNEDN